MNSPWFAEITLSFNNLEIFEHFDLHWDKVLRHRFWDRTQVDRNAPPVIRNIAKYRRDLEVDFVAMDFPADQDKLNNWSLQVLVWAQDDDWLNGLEEDGIASLFTKDTNVR